ncbi:hypothetical protein GCM10028819_14280 [Spirosoma humi]
MDLPKTYDQLVAENEALRYQLEEATDTIEAIRKGQVDALVVEGSAGHELYTLKTADHTYRILIETMNEGAGTLTTDGLIVYVNSSFAALVGLPASKVVGLSFIEFVEPASQPAFTALLQEGYNQVHKLELTLVGHGGKLIPCQLSLNALELDEGMCLSLILTDLTAQKENQVLLTAKNQQLQETNQALNRSNLDLMQFASVASHDLREPLRKVQTFGTRLEELLADRLTETEADLFRRLISSSARMQTLVGDVLRYSQLSDQTIPTEPVDLNQVISQIQEDLALVVSERQGEIICRQLPTLAAMPGQMHQLFQNLISNGLKFNTNPRPRILIEAVEPTTDLIQALSLPTTNYLIISVTDNGIGFDEKYKERIFGMFQRLHTRSAYAGTGIGLTIVKKIIDNHQGYLAVQSQPNQGTTFRIAFPDSSLIP